MIYFYIVVFLMHIMETIAGFGSTSIGIPILALAIGTEKSLLLLSAAGLALCLIVLSTQYKKIQYKELFIILACIVPIMPVGYLLYAKLRTTEWILRLIMGTFITIISAREIWRRIVRKDNSDPPRWLIYSSLGVGAIVQGMLSIGGALINVYALTRIKDKSEFRATMVVVWLVTNIISLMFRVFVLHAYTAAMWTAVLYSLPLIGAAYYLGNKLHNRIPNERFANVVYCIQLTSGIISISSGIALLV